MVLQSKKNEVEEKKQQQRQKNEELVEELICSQEKYLGSHYSIRKKIFQHFLFLRPQFTIWYKGQKKNAPSTQVFNSPAHDKRLKQRQVQRSALLTK